MIISLDSTKFGVVYIGLLMVTSIYNLINYPMENILIYVYMHFPACGYIICVLIIYVFVLIEAILIYYLKDSNCSISTNSFSYERMELCAIRAWLHDFIDKLHIRTYTGGLGIWLKMLFYILIN